MMRKLRESKISIVVVAIAGLIALVLLSAALRELDFQPPVPFSFDLSSFYGLVYPGSGMRVPPWKYFMFGGLLLLVLAVIMFFLDPDLRKKMLRKLLRFALALAAIWYLASNVLKKDSLAQLIKLGSAGAAKADPAADGAIPPVYLPPQLNPWLIFAVSFLVGLALVLYGWMVYSRRMKLRGLLVRDEMAGIAREALDDLQPGRNWDDAIVRAYVRMNEVVSADRGLSRQPGNTPSEFAMRMEHIGLPAEAVRALTRLFEGVRYGGRSSDPADRDLAAAALSAILHSCGRKA
ncbi:MAG TPA: DUF4129 domain-containing protein [Anaerolineales bacterium]|jgi:hypothetical protein